MSIHNATAASAATFTKKRKVVTKAGFKVNLKDKHKATAAKPKAKPKDPATPMLSPLSGKGKGAGKSTSPPGATDKDPSHDTVSKAEFTVLMGELWSLAGNFKAFKEQHVPARVSEHSDSELSESESADSDVLSSSNEEIAEPVSKKSHSSSPDARPAQRKVWQLQRDLAGEAPLSHLVGHCLLGGTVDKKVKAEDMGGSLHPRAITSPYP